MANVTCGCILIVLEVFVCWIDGGSFRAVHTDKFQSSAMSGTGGLQYSIELFLFLCKKLNLEVFVLGDGNV